MIVLELKWGWVEWLIKAKWMPIIENRRLSWVRRRDARLELMCELSDAAMRWRDEWYYWCVESYR